MKAIQKAREDYKRNPNTLVFWIVCSSYLYYHHDYSLFSDEEYDKMMKLLLDKWDTIQHKLKKHITKADLRAGTLYALKERDLTNTMKWLCLQIKKENEDEN
jgi:NAD-dependent DNA ligase